MTSWTRGPVKISGPKMHGIIPGIAFFSFLYNSLPLLFLSLLITWPTLEPQLSKATAPSGKSFRYRWRRIIYLLCTRKYFFLSMFYIGAPENKTTRGCHTRYYEYTDNLVRPFDTSETFTFGSKKALETISHLSYCSQWNWTDNCDEICKPHTCTVRW